MTTRRDPGTKRKEVLDERQVHRNVVSVTPRMLTKAAYLAAISQFAELLAWTDNWRAASADDQRIGHRTKEAALN